jgi:PRTRC genetic system ThiF family protein
MDHTIHPELLAGTVRVMIVGCGGNGSAVAAGLPYLHQALLAYGHPGGLHVTLVDGDLISATNCVRQPFCRSEIGLHKSTVLVNRMNLFWGFEWEAVPEHLSSRSRLEEAQIVIGCVDSAASRSVIRYRTSGDSRVHYWLDLGNKSDGGQFVVGEPLNGRNRRSAARLRTVAELFPEVVDRELRDDEPSCSAAEALERQEPFVNPTLANHALALLARLFRYGRISYQGGFVSLAATARVQPLPIDPKCWNKMRRWHVQRTAGATSR